MWIIKRIFRALFKFIWFLLRPIVWAIVVFLLAWTLRATVLSGVFEKIQELSSWFW